MTHRELLNGICSQQQISLMAVNPLMAYTIQLSFIVGYTTCLASIITLNGQYAFLRPNTIKQSMTDCPMTLQWQILDSAKPVRCSEAPCCLQPMMPTKSKGRGLLMCTVLGSTEPEPGGSSPMTGVTVQIKIIQSTQFLTLNRWKHTKLMSHK